MAKRKGRRKKPKGGYRSPGVYVEEISSGARPIEGVGTSVAAFVGSARRQPVRTAVTAAVILAAGIAVARALRH